MMKWFGLPRPDPDDVVIPAPVGEACMHCGEPIAAGDRGCAMPCFDNSGERERPLHFECHIRMIVGSLAHQQGRCSCFGGTEHDPPGMTLHQAALAAYHNWEAVVLQ